MIRREAIDLKVNGVESAGTFFYNLINDDISKPPFVLRRESWLEFTVPSNATKKQVDSIVHLFTKDNTEVDIEDNGEVYKAFITDWSVDKLKKIFTGRMEMIDKWYE